MDKCDVELERRLKASDGMYRLLLGDMYPARARPPLPEIIEDFCDEQTAIDIARKLNDDLPKGNGKLSLAEEINNLVDGSKRIIEKSYFVTNDQGIRLY